MRSDLKILQLLNAVQFMNKPKTRNSFVITQYHNSGDLPSRNSPQLLYGLSDQTTGLF